MELPPELDIPEEKKASAPLMTMKDSTLAIASLITGILGWTIIPLLGSVAAIITGHLAHKEIDESQGSLGGRSMATAGLIMGYLQLGFVALAAIVIVILIIVLGPSWMA